MPVGARGEVGRTERVAGAGRIDVVADRSAATCSAWPRTTTTEPTDASVSTTSGTAELGERLGLRAAGEDARLLLGSFRIATCRSRSGS